jgi:biopolymer transport protein ExbD
MRSRRRKLAAADIDITSLIDMMFMLIIFFVLTTAFVQGVLDVDLPSGSPQQPLAKNPVVIAIGSDSSLSWAGEKITREDLARLVGEAAIRSDDILVAGDREARYGDVAEILNLLRELGVQDVALAFDGTRQ